MNPRELRVCFEGFKKRIENERREKDFLNHLLGKYISLGVNAPKKYPNKPFLSEETSSDDKSHLCYTDEARQLQAKLMWGKERP